MRHDGSGSPGAVPPCFEPLIERSSEHELLTGGDGLPALRGALHGYAYRFSFAVQEDDWDDDDEAPHRIRWHFVMDFPFGFDVRVRLKPGGKKKKSKIKARRDPTTANTGIAAFDERFDAQAADAHLGRALPWLRDGTFLEVLESLCQAKVQVRMRVDSLNVSSPGWKGSLADARETIESGEWPPESELERVAAAAQRLRGCFRRLGGAVDAQATPHRSAGHVSDPPSTAAPGSSPALPVVIVDSAPPTPRPAEPPRAQPQVAASGASPLHFIGDPPPPPAPPQPDVLRIGFDEPAPPPPRPRIRPHTGFPPQPPSAQPGSFVRITDTSLRRPSDFASTWDVAHLPQLAGLRRLCANLDLKRNKEGHPGLAGEIGGFPFDLRVRWTGGKRNLADASDFNLELEMKCKPEFEAAVHRESWSLRWKKLTGSLQDVKVGRPTLDEKYFFTFTGGSKGRFTDLMLDAESEPILDALTDLCGSVTFGYDWIRVGVSDREVERPKANYDPFGEGLWPPQHFLDNLVPATHNLAVRVNGLDTGLIFRRLRMYGMETD